MNPIERLTIWEEEKVQKLEKKYSGVQKSSLAVTTSIIAVLVILAVFALGWVLLTLSEGNGLSWQTLFPFLGPRLN